MSISIGLAPAILVVVVAVVLGYRLRRTERPATILAAVGGMLGVFLICGAILFLLVSRAQKAAEKAQRAQKAAELERTLHLDAPPYQQEWERQPKEGAFPGWLKESKLFSPERGQSPAGSFAYVKQDDQGRIAGYSGFEKNEEDAKRAARRCALVRLRSLVRANCAVKEPSRIEGAGPFRLEDVIEEELLRRRPEIEIDSFHDQVQLDYGTVHRGAVLVRAAPSLIDEVAVASLKKLDETYRTYREEREALMARWAYYVGGAVFLFFIILAIYLFLNAQTKGYYAWPLRLLAIAIYAAAVGAFMLLVSRVSQG